MAYSKQTWDTTSYVNPTRMNHIEDGIADNAFESGSNANGYYMKFADGTLICTKTITGEVNSASDWASWGSLYTYLASGGNWAMNFYSTPQVSATNVSGDAGFMVGYVKGLSANGFSNVLIVRPTAPQLLGYGISIIAIGRWKA